MADQKKFEEMLERLINEDKAGAEELFHEIVVEKSREIYETLLSEEEDEDDDIDEADKMKDGEEDEMDATGKKAPKKGGMKTGAVKEDEDEEVDEASDDEDLEEDFDLDEFEVEADPMDAMMGGDETDDMMGDIEGGDEGEDDDEGEEGEEELEDRVVDLEDALDELKAEFEKMMAGEEGEESDDDMDMDMGDEEGDDEEEKEAFAFEAKQKMDPKTGKPMKDDKADAKDPKKMAPKSAGETMKEYVQKVTANMGDNGQNTKSPVAGKNDMGGTTANIVKGGDGGKGGTQGGLLNPSTKEENAGNVNVPGGKASKSMTAMPKGHGAEKKGAGEQAANKKSTIGSK
jgi:hypothetical protein